MLGLLQHHSPPSSLVDYSSACWPLILYFNLSRFLIRSNGGP